MNEKSMTQAEWQVMRVLWAYPNSRSSQIIERLERDFSWKPTTIKTLLNRLKTKGLLVMKKESGKYYYHALVTEEEHLKQQWTNILQNVCQTRQGSLLENILEESVLSRTDLEHLAQVIHQKLETAPEQVFCACPKGQCLCGHSCHEEVRE